MIKVTYMKKNGEIVERYNTVLAPYKIGETNGFGWKVINKEYSYKNKYYSSAEHDMLIYRDLKRQDNFIKFKKNIIRSYRKFEYLFFFLILVRYVGSLTKVL